MQYQTVYEAASGPSHLECAFIARRFDVAHGYIAGESESLIVTSRHPPGSERARMATQIGTRGHYTGVWRSMSESPTVWACARRGWVGHLPVDAPAGSQWEREKLETQPLGMTGIDAGDHAGVYVWGAIGAAHSLHRRRPGGERFESIPHPGLRIASLVGDERGLLAVGEGGAGRFAEGKWTRLRVDVDTPLVAAALQDGKLFAASEDGIFLAGDEALAEVAHLPSALPGDIRAIARWRGATWVAAGRLGLWRLDDGETSPVCVREDCDPRSLDARRNLLFATSNLVASTSDGESFKASGKNFVLEARCNAALGEFQTG